MVALRCYHLQVWEDLVILGHLHFNQIYYELVGAINQSIIKVQIP